jgi:uncharacterized protein (DUF305 family)
MTVPPARTTMRSLVKACLVVCAGLAIPAIATAQTLSGAPSAPTTTKAGNNSADVHFMAGMIPHHAQAVLIAGWAPSHGARLDVRTLCERIVVGQQDEIRLMQFWLREHGEPVPDAKATHMKMEMNGMEHDMLMPGMLNEAQLAALDKARGSDFDRLFLQAMIGHHEGAITMVDALFASKGAGNDDIVYRFASDVYADQSTEIERMGKMLATVPPPAP